MVAAEGFEERVEGFDAFVGGFFGFVADEGGAFWGLGFAVHGETGVENWTKECESGCEIRLVSGW